MNDVYAGFKWNPYDAKIGKEIIKEKALGGDQIFC